MYILAFETTGPICSVALIDLENKERVFVVNGKEPMSHLKSLTVNAKTLMDEFGIGMNEIAAVAAAVGPGSFTGIRIGVTTARAVAQALDIPCVAVPTLEVFRECAGADDTMRGEGTAACDEHGQTCVVPVFNARRGQVYAAIFAGCADEVEDVLTPGPYMLEEVLAELKKHCQSHCGDVQNSDADAMCISDGNALRIVFYGDGVDAYAERLAEFREEMKNVDVIFAPEETRYQTADMVAGFAAEKFARGETCSHEELMPDYMRKAEAEQKLEDGTLQKLREEKLARLMKGH